MHGAAEHALRYDRFACFLASEGYGVLATDLRGHGATAQGTGGYGSAEGNPADGTGGTADAWRACVSDVRTAGDRARTLHPGVPVVLLGHGTGSVLARCCAQEHPDDLAGLVLTGAFRMPRGRRADACASRLEGEARERGRNAPSTVVAELFAALAAPYDDACGPAWRSRDEAEVAAYAADERCGFPLSAGLALDWLHGARAADAPDARARVPADLPVHIAVGADDPCHQELSHVHALLDDFREAGVTDLSWRVYEGARHDVLGETNRTEVYRDLGEWLAAHVL